MCGIAGWYRRRGRPVAPQVIGRQCDQIIHRGPDDSGSFVDGDFGFGMRRLSIIDIPGGHQPMFSPDGLDLPGGKEPRPRPEMKLRGNARKYALRKAVEPWLPEGALDRRKQGFQLPFTQWLRGDFGDFAQEAWRDSGAMDSGYLQSRAVEELFAEHRAGRADHSRILYAIAMFSCWWRQAMTPSQSSSV